MTECASQANPPGQWCLYLLECENGALYAGITNDLLKRFEAHLSGKGAKYTRANRPRRIVAAAPFKDRAQASRAEWAIKNVPKNAKVALIQSFIDSAAQHHIDNESDAQQRLTKRPRPTL